jgi:hypothetical protein
LFFSLAFFASLSLEKAKALAHGRLVAAESTAALASGFGRAPIPGFAIPLARFGEVFFFGFDAEPSRSLWILRFVTITLFVTVSFLSAFRFLCWRASEAFDLSLKS